MVHFHLLVLLWKEICVWVTYLETDAQAISMHFIEQAWSWPGAYSTCKPYQYLDHKRPSIGLARTRRLTFNQPDRSWDFSICSLWREMLLQELLIMVIDLKLELVWRRIRTFHYLTCRTLIPLGSNSQCSFALSFGLPQLQIAYARWVLCLLSLASLISV